MIACSGSGKLPEHSRSMVVSGSGAIGISLVNLRPRSVIVNNIPQSFVDDERHQDIAHGTGRLCNIHAGGSRISGQCSVPDIGN
jgi:hypothetical protein